jgi:hypothetical protein
VNPRTDMLQEMTVLLQATRMGLGLAPGGDASIGELKRIDPDRLAALAGRHSLEALTVRASL